MRRIAVVVAALLIVGVLAAPVAAQARPEPAARAALAPRAIPGPAITVGLFVLDKLANLTANETGGTGFGKFLMTLGFGDANAAALASIQSTLNEINMKLDAIQASVNRIEAAVHAGLCKQDQAKLSLTETAIKQAWKIIGTTVDEAKAKLNEPVAERKTGQEKLGADLIAAIKNEFRVTSLGGAVTQVHDALVGTPGSGGQGMIQACGLAYQKKAGDFLDYRLQDEVASLVGYWQTLEAEAAVMQIGVLVNEGKRATATSARAEAVKHLSDETAKIKPSLRDPARGDMVLDLRTHLLWRRDWLSNVAADKAGVIGATYAPAGQWKLPDIGQLRDLAKSCCGNDGSVARWFKNSTPFVLQLGVGNTQLVSGTVYPYPLAKRFFSMDIGGGYPITDYVNANASVYAAFLNTKSAQEWQRYTY